jgi:hypothetical protein
MLTPQIVEALKAHWAALLAIYGAVLLGTLYLGLRRQQKGMR